ncbi:UbiA prenyltransferase family protein [uncultured Duncaniella sp.]|uniref:UbiA prenyltransferase family protein n=1 Tax=uncultured Duncaniella sp. TaxID=2768039 RepID=UPI0025F32FE8|nr:UbiA prenyltransferase family protein [uncultured Duncaniella sp.]
MTLLSLAKLIRPHQWVKNFFVALPLFFSGSMLNLWCWKQTLITFFAFSLAASSIYCLNDILDADIDRMHPKKKLRPIACNQVSASFAYGLMGMLTAGSLSLCLILGKAHAPAVVSMILLYIFLNLAYCIKLKHYAIIDVFIISVGFVLRLCAGGLACSIWLSPWIVCMTFLIALFLAFAKRRDDVVIRQTTGNITRENTMRYNLEFMNQTLGLLGAITIVCYIIYTVSPDVETRMGSQYVYITSVFVLAGILRYLQVTIVDVRSGSPTKILLRDRFIQSCVVLWILVFVTIIYL